MNTLNANSPNATEKECAQCHAPFWVYPYQAATAKFCSRQCRYRAMVTHGQARINGKPSVAYTAWASMKERCLNPANPSYPRYGGRGITVCRRWLDSFENFLADMGTPATGLSLERKENSGNYEPTNCVWATAKEQSQNTRRTRRLTIDGVTQCASAWAEIAGIGKGTVYSRLRSGWDAKTAVFTKVRQSCKQTKSL